MRPIVALFLLLGLSTCGKTGERGDSSRRDSIQVGRDNGDSTSFASLSTAEKEMLRESLMKEGKYDCCTRPGCTECIGKKQQCACYLDIKQKDPICGECLEEYKAGHGKLKLVNIVELEEIRKRKGKN